MAQSRPTKTRTAKPQPQAAQARADTPATNRTRAPTSARRAGAPASAKPPSTLTATAARAGRAKLKLGASPQTQARMEVAKPSPSVAASAVPPASSEAGRSKQARVIAMLRRAEGATIADLMAATGWLSHSVRGAISGVLKRKLGLVVESRVESDRGRVYRTGAEPTPAAVALKPSRRARAPGASAAAAPGEAG